MDRALLKRILSDQIQAFQVAPTGILREVPGIPIHSHISSPEVSMLTGVRRCGKSTFLRQIASILPQPSRTLFLNLEDPLLDGFTANDFQIVLELWAEFEAQGNRELPSYVFLDEAQVIPGWERWARSISERPGHKVFVTGSNSAMLSTEVGSALTGRHMDIQLFGFGVQELLEHHLKLSALSSQAKVRPDVRVQMNSVIERLLNYGGFPRCYLEESTHLLPVYFNDIVTRDILSRKKIRNSSALLHLGNLLSREHTRLFNHSKISKVLGIRDNLTLANYCEYFKECFLFFELRAYSPSLRKQMRSLSKFYSVDCRLPSAVAPTVHGERGASFENLVFLELRRYSPRISYWHSAKGYEVDFIVEHSGELLAVQAAYSLGDKNTQLRETRSLAAARVELGCHGLYVITASESRELREKSELIQVLPVDQVGSVFA